MFGVAVGKEVEYCHPRHQLASQKTQEFTSKTLQTKLQFFDFQSRAGDRAGAGAVPKLAGSESLLNMDCSEDHMLSSIVPIRYAF